MSRVLSGVDYLQWRALLRAYIWIDFAALRGAHGEREARRALMQLVAGGTFLTLMGLGLAVVVWIATDPFSAALLVTSSTMLLVGLIALVQVGTLATPDDLGIVGFRPVSSQTLFAVRLSALLVHPAATTVLVGWLPAVAFLTRDGGSFPQAAAATAAIAGSGLAVVLGVVAVYGWLIRRVPAERLSRALAWASSLAGLALAATIVAASDHEDPGRLFTTVIPRDERTLWFPASWFAAYVAVAEGSAGLAEAAAATLSAGILLALLLSLRGRTSLDYFERVSDLSTLTAPRVPGGTWRLLRGEVRAITVLVASHLRYDVRFQLAMASSVAMAVMFTVMGSTLDELPRDPFVDGSASAALMLPLFVLLWIPSQIYQALVISPEHDAAWIFHGAPADAATLVVRARDAVALAVLGPVVLLMAAFCMYAYRHPGHALLHALMAGVLAFGMLQLNVLLAPRLPFSVPMTNAGFAMGPQLLMMLIGVPVFIGSQFVAYRSLAHYTAVLLAMAILTATMTRLTRRRVARRSD